MRMFQIKGKWDVWPTWTWTQGKNVATKDIIGTMFELNMVHDSIVSIKIFMAEIIINTEVFGR